MTTLKSNDPTGPGPDNLILVVDDEEFILRLLRKMLSRSGFEVISALTAVEALDIFEREHERIRLVISDLDLPDFNGSDLLQCMRQLQPDVRIIISSGGSEPLLAKTMGEVSAWAFLQKPYDLGPALQVIRRAINADTTLRLAGC